MIPLTLAQDLKAAGLVWRTNNYDFFAVPDRGLDDRLFVLADMMAYTELVQGWPVVAFHGTAEWALDYILTSEVVWVPTEEQLREALIDQLVYTDGAAGGLILSGRAGSYRCEVEIGSQTLCFDAPTAGEAYGLALLSLLRQKI
jgi:hypothetical protein